MINWCQSFLGIVLMLFTTDRTTLRRSPTTHSTAKPSSHCVIFARISSNPHSSLGGTSIPHSTPLRTSSWGSLLFTLLFYFILLLFFSCLTLSHVKAKVGVGIACISFLTVSRFAHGLRYYDIFAFCKSCATCNDKIVKAGVEGLLHSWWESIVQSIIHSCYSLAFSTILFYCCYGVKIRTLSEHQL